MEADLNRIVGVGIHVQDLDRSIAFYTNALGLEVQGRWELPDVTQVLLGYGTHGSGSTITLVADPEVPGPMEAGTALSRIILQVADGASAVVQVAEWGGAVVREPREIRGSNGVSAFHARDPDGVPLEIISRAS